MEINLLGPLEVLRDGVVLTPSAPKLRSVLSLLVLQTNSVVRTERIIEELWEDDPPASVSTTLQTYIYQLRKLLQLTVSPAPSDTRDARNVVTLRTSACGYTLILDPEMLDAVRFEQRSEQGRRELEADRAQQATETLARALELWRGPALVDVAHGPVLRAETLRLEEMYRNTLEQRIEADLRHGRHHELLGELTRLAAREPTHEGFQGKLMLALYRAGRRSEALEVYQRTRRMLATHLGVDPSGTLEHLHSAVLAADQTLDVPRAAATIRGRTQPPRQLPPAGPALVGRRSQADAALTALTARQQHAPPVVVVTGPPGSGKSALCARIGHQANGSYPDGQLYAKLLDACGHTVETTDVLAEFLRAVDVPDERIPETAGERCRMFRTWTADRRVLVTLDDVISPDQMLPLVPASPECGVLIAARRQLSAPEITAALTVAPLDVEDGVRLLTNMLGDSRIAQDEAAARELVRLCDGLPAALHAAAGRLALRPHWSIGRLVARLRTELEGPVTADGSPLGVYSSVEATCRLAPPVIRSAFRTLTMPSTPRTSPRQAAHLLGVSETYAESLLEELAELQLIQAEPDADSGLPSYRFLSTVLVAGRQLPYDDTTLAMAVPRPASPRHDVPPDISVPGQGTALGR